MITKETLDEHLADRSMLTLPSKDLWSRINHLCQPALESFGSIWERLSASLDFYYARSVATRNYSWAVPCPRAIDSIAAFADGAQILEVGSGLGLWARLLRDHGAAVVATDSSPGLAWSKPDEYVGTYTAVEQLSALEAVAQYPDSDVLMIVWPPYNTPMAAQALRAFKGERLVYIGEDRGGCCADEEFFRLLDLEWHWWRTMQIPQWPGIHDALYFGRRLLVTH